MNLFELINYIPKVIDIILKLILLSIAIFFGRISLSGWRGKLDIFTKIIGTLILGFLCFVVGILLPFNFFQIKFISSLINSLIVAAVLYVILFLLSVKKPIKFFTKEEAIELRKEIDFLKAEIAKINKALIEKGIAPKPISEKDAIGIVKDLFKKSGIERYEIKSAAFYNNLWNITAISGKKKFSIVIDSGGNVIEFKKFGFEFSDIIKRLREDKPFLIGSIITILFAIFVLSLLTPQNIEKVSETFQFYGFEVTKEKCLSPDKLLEFWSANIGRTNYSYNKTAIEIEIKIYFNESLYVSPFLYEYHAIVKKDGIYGAFFVTEEKVESLPKQLSLLQASIISGSNYICSIELSKNKICSCKNFGDPRVIAQITTFLEKFKEEVKSQ